MGQQEKNLNHEARKEGKKKKEKKEKKNKNKNQKVGREKGKGQLVVVVVVAEKEGRKEVTLERTRRKEKKLSHAVLCVHSAGER